MASFFGFLLFVCTVALLVGLVKPAILKFKSRKRVVAILGSAVLVLFVLVGVTADKPKATEDRKTAKPQPISQPETQAVQVNAPIKTLEDKITEAINTKLRTKTNMGKPRLVGIEVEKYKATQLTAYGYKNSDTVVRVFIQINADENITTKLQKLGMNTDAATIAQAVFPLDQSVGDIIILSQLPLKDKYGNVKDDTAIVYSIARPLFSKVSWQNFYASDLSGLLKSEHSIDDRNNYLEQVRF